MIPHRKIEAKRRTNDPTRNGAEHSDDTVLEALIWRSELPAIVWLIEFPQRPEPSSASVGARMTGWPPLVYSTSRKPSDPTTHCWQVRTLTTLVSKRMSLGMAAERHALCQIRTGFKGRWNGDVSAVLGLWRRTVRTPSPHKQRLKKNTYRRTDVGRDGYYLPFYHGNTKWTGGQNMGFLFQPIRFGKEITELGVFSIR